MKSLHCVYHDNKFADQYTLDLDGFLSIQEFNRIMNTFNTSAINYPPPTKTSGKLHFILLFVILISIMILMHQTNQIGFILALPFSVLLLSMTFIYQRRRQRNKFETAMIHLCSCMNATQNVRGINFKLTFLTPEQQIAVYPSSTYAITIEFDDRYNILHSNDYSKLSLPPPAYYNKPLFNSSEKYSFAV